MSPRLCVVAALLAAFSACAPPNVVSKNSPAAGSQAADQSDGKPKGSSSKNDDDDKDDEDEDETPAPKPDEPDEPAVDPTPAARARRLTGSRSAGSSSNFGGGEHCNFRETLSNVVVNVSVDAKGIPTTATVNALATEQVLSNPCVKTAIRAHTQTWRMQSTGIGLIGGRTIKMKPDSTNLPPSELIITGDFTKSPTTVSLAWHRTDYGAPLDWRISTSVSLSE